MTWDRKVINKYNHLETVQEKVDILAHQVKLFIEIFDLLFKKGIPLFWRDKGAMLNKDEYYEKLIAWRQDHLNFADMTESLTGKVLVKTLVDEFEIFITIK